MSMTTIREQKRSLSALTDGSVVLRVREKDVGQEDERFMLCSGYKLGALTGVCLETQVTRSWGLLHAVITLKDPVSTRSSDLLLSKSLDSPTR